MKKITVFAFFLTPALSLAACSGGNGGAPKNEIVSASLTTEQQEIFEMISNYKHEILFFDYQTEGAYKRVDVRVEVYENGVLTDRPAGLSTGGDTASPHKGSLAVVINQTPDFQWTITLDDNGSRSTHAPTGTAGIAVDPALARGFGPMTGGAAIESGKEIILYSSVFTSGNTMTTIDDQTLEDRPEALKEYEYVHLIKCKFE